MKTFIILECKGRVEDVNNINAHIPRQTVFDLCHEQQGFRAEAKKQIDEMDLSNIRSGTSSVIRQKIPFGISQQASTKNVLVSSIPDGRILWLCDPSVKFATRQKCSPMNVTCNKCMANSANPLPDDSSLANVISVLYREKIVRGSPIDQGLSTFLTRYRSVLRAAWSGNDTFFGTSLRAFIDLVPNIEDQDMLSTAIFMITTLIETAIFDGLVYFDFGKSEQISLRTDAYIQEVLQNALHLALNKFHSLRDSSRKRVEIAEERHQKRVSGNTSSESWDESLKWYDLDPDMDRIFRFAQEKRETTLLISTTIPEWNDTIYGSVYYEEPFTLIIRLASATKQRPALKEYIQALIARFRETEFQELDWKDEYFGANNQSPFVVGASWDMFPYPNSRNGKPGITAWLAEDGIAEVIVRTLVV